MYICTCLFVHMCVCLCLIYAPQLFRLQTYTRHKYIEMRMSAHMQRERAHMQRERAHIMHLSICTCLHTCICLSTDALQHTVQYVLQRIHKSAHMHLSIYRCLCAICVHLSIYMCNMCCSAYVSQHTCICLSIHMCICLCLTYAPQLFRLQTYTAHCR